MWERRRYHGSSGLGWRSGLLPTFALTVALSIGFTPVAAQGGESEESEQRDSESPSREREENEPSGDEASGDSESEGREAGDEGSEYTWDDEEDLFDVEESAEQAEEGENEEEPGARPRPDVSLDKMSKSDARRAGFEFGDEQSASRQTGAVLLASTAGLVVHGAGHWYNRDPRTAAFLAGTEGAGLVLAGVGLTAWFLEGETPVGRTIGSKTFHAGAGLFGLTYLLDIVGAVRQGNAPIPDNQRDLRGVTVEAGYRFLEAGGYALNHHLHGAVDVEFNRFYGRLETEQEFNLESSRYRAEIGGRWWRGARTWTHAYTDGGFELFDLRGTDGFNRWQGELRVGASLDLGVVSSHFERVALGVEVGYGRGWYLSDSQSSDDAAVAVGFVPLEVYSHFNLTDRVHTRVAYEQVPSRKLQATRALGGVGTVELVYDSTDLFDLELSAEVGGGIAIMGNLLVHVWE